MNYTMLGLGGVALAVGMPVVVSTPAYGQNPQQPLAGHLRALSVKRTYAKIQIDGNIDDAVWAEAAIASDFWVSEFGRAPKEATEVRVLADDKALYFAFKCLDTRPGEVHAEQTKRDAGLSFDDQVTVEL